MGMRWVSEIRGGEQVPQTCVKEVCRKSTSSVVTNLYTFRDERSDELGGMVEILLQEETEDVKKKGRLIAKILVV